MRSVVAVTYGYSCFFFQAEDGIRDRDVTGVQTCALPISCILKLQLPFDEEPSEVDSRVMSLSVTDHHAGLAFTADREVILRYITALKLESVSDYF